MIISRNRLTVYLSIAIAVIAFTAYMEYRALEKIHQNLLSIYSDRLIPATEMFYISDHLYENRLGLEDYFAGSQPLTPEVSHESRNQAIDSIIVEFEKTYIVSDESRYLDNFKQHYREYLPLEDSILSYIGSGKDTRAREIFNGESRVQFNEMVTALHQLTRVQSNVGEQLLKDADLDYASTSMLSYLRLAAVIVIALLIISMLRQSESSKPN